MIILSTRSAFVGKELNLFIATRGIHGKKKHKTPTRRKDKHINPKMMHVMWFAGLRSAVAYACVRDFPDVLGHNDEFVTATVVIVLGTIIGFGGTTEMFFSIYKLI